MISAMPKKMVRRDDESRAPRTGVVNAKKVQDFVGELKSLTMQATALLDLFKTAPDGELIVDGVGLADRGIMQCGLFIDNVKSASRRQKRFSN